VEDHVQAGAILLDQLLQPAYLAYHVTQALAKDFLVAAGAVGCSLLLWLLHLGEIEQEPPSSGEVWGRELAGAARPDRQGI
jgi:hypothetical protein